MASLVSYLFSNKPQAPQTSWTVDVDGNSRGHLHVNRTGNEKQTVIEVVDKLWYKTKGVADLLSVVSKTAALAQEFTSAQREWLSYIASTFSQGKNILAVPYFLTTVKNAIAPNDSRLNRFRNWTEAASMAGFAGNQWVPPNAWTKTVGGTASCLKTVVDAIDLKKEMGTYRTYSNLRDVCNDSTRNISEEVKKGVSDKLIESSRRIAKYFLGTLSGLVAATVFLFGVVLPPSVVVAALAASLGSSIASVAAEYCKETSPWSVEYKEIPVKDASKQAREASGKAVKV